MTNIDLEFKDRTGLEMTWSEAGFMRNVLTQFYLKIEKICGHPDQYCGTGIDAGFADTVRCEFGYCRTGFLTDFHMYGLILREMPEYWPPRYRASVSYFLSPFAAYYFEDPKTPAWVLAKVVRDRLGIPQYGG